MAVSHENAALAVTDMNSSSLTFALQALLHRHESYMAEAEEDRHRLLASIESLEREKRQAQAENARIIEENHSHAKSLTVSLETAEAEVRKLTASAARAADLEAQLAQMEAEQYKLQESLLSAHEDSKSAVQRWKTAECTLRDLHDQVDRIEKEAREERDRHADLIQRMERRRAVERELDGAAGRLKGAAAAQELGWNQGGTVVSRFVRDILQDNANLQMGIVELREMLESSNQEVQNLREQILSHQPLVPKAGEDRQGSQPATTLGQELEEREPRRVSQEFHVHHHYHTPPVSASSKKDKAMLFRRSKKRRSLGNPSILHSASGTQLARKSMHRSQSSTSSTSTILSQTSVSIPPTSSHRWSLQSPTVDSMASSPQSAYRSSYIFDRVERGFDSSQATSPESTVLVPPMRGAAAKHGLFGSSCRQLDGPEGLDEAGDGRLEDDLFDDYSVGPVERAPLESVIPEEREDSSVQYAVSERACSPAPLDEAIPTPYRPLRRGTSHESLFSVAGMDIHTPSRRPSRLSDMTSTALPIHMTRRIMSYGAERFSTTPVTSTTTVMAGREPFRVSDQSPEALLASVAASGGQISDTPSASTVGDRSNSTATPTRKISLSRRVGGWVRGRWGTAPVVSHGDLQPAVEEEPTPSASLVQSESSTPSYSAGKKYNHKAESSPSLRFRYPGVNQKGPIMGFRPSQRAPATVHAEQIDECLLRETLAE
ncbi:hypothetical protein EYZ11_001787 [Aspergillus tanneri]|uniref:Uncharacterized protein n=1 Tax=Aspergillus tanneri TaxID=1220188 RepID=A0A4V3UQE8_9EURO|nr:hypothetical protein EYZ11_001787 [Aspergillus tanneri]